jgi:hypothetical protein
MMIELRSIPSCLPHLFSRRTGKVLVLFQPRDRGSSQSPSRILKREMTSRETRAASHQQEQNTQTHTDTKGESGRGYKALLGHFFPAFHASRP